MEFHIEKMNRKMATIILDWTYEQPYDFYNNERTEEALDELLDGSYYAIVDINKKIVGFFCTGENARLPSGKQFGVYKEDLIDIGLGMHPKCVGQGKGLGFCSYILKFIMDKHPSKSLRLTVATFNQRAIHLYKKLGFVSENKFSSDVAHFITMVKM